MWTLVVQQVFVGSWLFFPMLSTSSYSIPNLTKEYCVALGEKQTKNLSESTWSASLEVKTTVLCIEQK